MGAFDGVKVFSATMVGPRQVLGETVTQWIEQSRQRPGFELVDVVVRQSSDDAFHCTTIIVFYKQASPAKSRRAR
jgi:hypothetical protein